MTQSREIGVPHQSRWRGNNGEKGWKGFIREPTAQRPCVENGTRNFIGIEFLKHFLFDLSYVGAMALFMMYITSKGTKFLIRYLYKHPIEWIQ